ncbi:MAG: hypothetical protein J7L43_02360 [Candidatus Aenigmarchaeota archaeon]|nr:hypothetical protein [Candidatus Aenigmarchaeota archaeon]
MEGILVIEIDGQVVKGVTGFGISDIETSLVDKSINEAIDTINAFYWKPLTRDVPGKPYLAFWRGSESKNLLVIRE